MPSMADMDTVLVLATLDMPLVLATLDTAMLLLPTDTMELTAMLPQLPVLELLSVDMEPLPQSEPTLHTAMLPADNMLLTPLELSILPRERPRLNQRLMLMLSMEIMDMVLATLLDTALATPDPSMEDTLPSPDPLFPAMLLLLLLDMLVLDTPEPSMEDTEVDTTEREKLRLNQRLMLMLSMEPMEDMVLATPDPLFPVMLLQLLLPQLLPAMLLQLSPDQLLPAMLLQSSPDQLLLPQLLPAMLPQLLPLAMLVLPDPLFPAMP